jgi:hypothetical protein
MEKEYNSEYERKASEKETWEHSSLKARLDK